MGPAATTLAASRPGTVPAHVSRGVDLKQVDHVRALLASSGVQVSTSTLERALVTPTVVFTAKERQEYLMQPGDMLPPNPFAAEIAAAKAAAKAKAKGKKGKKK